MKLKEKDYVKDVKIENRGGIMPDRDGKGPRKRSPKPSRRKGGDGKGKC